VPSVISAHCKDEAGKQRGPSSLREVRPCRCPEFGGCRPALLWDNWDGKVTSPGCACLQETEDHNCHLCVIWACLSLTGCPMGKEQWLEFCKSDHSDIASD